MADPVIVTVQYTPPGAADSLRLELHAEPGARLTLQLGARTTPASVPTQPQPTDWEDLSGRPKPPASPDWADLSGIRDWDLPGLPAECAPGRRPELLTDSQVTARLRYGYEQGWTQRRIGAFAGRAAGTVHKYVERFRAESKK
ncbi:hypothetical protein SAMN04490357_0016 [Streptomyces misionensis]|uniref:Uncharacterized protein n=1 Tax=Streptomyces misionensis TaxID=67331 RepID=A0A1H4I882_9ACTN|nr:helix-turn-helix domain-containing protein [Streptomyces misionensis]SEB29568.1 hypothetical protein SAMN04490357_0016 [Streptomyces misionensis]